jgi:hypothetical protein
MPPPNLETIAHEICASEGLAFEARAGAVESELHVRMREAGDDTRLEIDLQRDHDIEPPALEWEREQPAIRTWK